MQSKSVIKSSLVILCKICGEGVESSWKYCPNCMNKINQTRCTRCGHVMNEDWKYCPFCKNEKIITEEKENISLNGNDWIKEMLGK